MKKYVLNLAALQAFLDKPISDENSGDTTGILTESNNEEIGEEMAPEDLDLLYSSIQHVRAIKQLSKMKWAADKPLKPVKTILELQQWIAGVTVTYHLILSSENTVEEMKEALKEGKAIFGDYGSDMVKVGHDFLSATVKMFKRFAGKKPE